MRPILTRAAVWSTLALLLMVAAVAGNPAAAQEKKGESAKKTRAREAEVEKPKAARSRLPAYYSQVVDQQQREAIGKVQQEFDPQIAALKAQLTKLTQQRDEKIAALLTPEQHKKVAELQAAAKAKREHGKPAEEEKQPAEKKSSKAAPRDRSANLETK